MKPKIEIDPGLLERLAVLNKVADRNPEQVINGRAKYMQQAHELAPGVTLAEKRRHNGWKQSIIPMFMIRRKEHTPMFSTLATILIIVSLVLGGGGVTVVSAQSSQPDQPLYSVKLWSEDIRVNLASDPLAQYQLSMEFANRRAEEIQTMLQAGSIPPDAVLVRYQNQLERAIRFASNLPDAQALQALLQIQTRLQSQDQALQQVQANGSPNAASAILRNRQMIQEHLHWVQTGLNDPTQFKNQIQIQERQQSGTAIPTELPKQLGTPETTPSASGTNTSGNGFGPGPMATAIPGGPGAKH